MPIPTSITDLSASAGSNSPSGGDSPIDGDNFLRAHGAFIRQLYDGITASGYPTLAGLADTTDTAKGDAFVGVKRSETGTTATNLHTWINRQVLDTFADFNLTADSTTERSTAINAIMSALSGASFRGVLRIPAGTKFNAQSVLSAVPTGIMLDLTDTVNWGQPPTYKNKFRIIYTGDTVSDDSQFVVGSGHHPAIMLLNMGTAGSTAASDRYASILHAVGKDSDGDPVLGWLFQFAEEAGNSIWRTSLRLQTPYAVAIANPQPWVTATVYSAGAYVTSDGGKVYQTAAGGTSGVTAPTGTGASISDGGVTWAYVQSALNIDSTRFDWNENGRSGQYAPAGGAARHTMQAGSRSTYLEIDDSTDDVLWRDESRSLDILRVSDAHGLRFGIGQGQNWVATTGTGPNAPSTGYGKVTQGGATNMSTMVPPASRTTMMVTLRFDDGNTTLVHGTGTNALRLKGAANSTPAAGSFVTFAYDSGDTTSWREVSRSY